MAADGQKSLIGKSKKLAEIMRDLRELTANLHSVCSSEQPDSLSLADLLHRRQQLMNEAAKIYMAGSLQAAASLRGDEEDLANINQLGEIRRLLEEIAALDKKAKIFLEEKRDKLKAELAGLRAGRAAGKAYGTKAPQEEGLFFDRREN
ncbi:MAG: flagellar protein FliT [Clostridium sp.]|nr:flagellar protein FliT [Clostridium sp.]